MNIFDIDSMWAGTEESLYAYIAKLEPYAGVLEPEDYEPPKARLLEVQGEIGVISIKGPLNNTDSWINSFIGATGYPEMREALIEAASNPEIKAIALDIDSPGGVTAGLADTADLVSTIDTKVKPVYAFTDGNMASAAYWLGAGARQITASKVAVVGSIGIVQVHTERSAALEKEGIKATVVRAGKYKYLNNPVEPLSEEGKAQMQQLVDAVYEVFLDHIADSRGQSRSVVMQTMAEGRIFLGESARQVGLVDHIAAFDHFMSQLSAQLVDNRKNFNENKYIGATMTTRKALTQAEIAALAEGVDIHASNELPENTNTEDVQALANSENGEAPEGTEATTGEVAAEGETEGETEATTEESEAVADTEITAFLRGQVSELQAELVSARVELTNTTSQLEAAQASMGGLLDIARHSVANMQIALGGSALNMEGRSADDVLAEHTRLSADFQNRFKAGGVAATVAAEPQAKAGPKRSRAESARLAASAVAANPR